MCGIIASFNDGKHQRDSVNKWVIDSLENQISRGKEGFGIIFIGKDNKIKVERATELTKAMIDLYKTKARMIILHHRQPTSSDNKLSQTHPIFVDNGSLKYRYYVIHNGVISNAESVKISHEKLGFEYTTAYTQSWSNATPEIKFNDSEALAIELARFIEKQTDTLAVIGSAAFIGIQVDRKTNKVVKVFFGRNTQPLNMSATRGKLRLSSEGEGSPVKENLLYKFDLKDFSIKSSKLVLEKEKTTVVESTHGVTGFKSYEDYSYRSHYSSMGKDTAEEYLEEKLMETNEVYCATAQNALSEFFDKLNDIDILLALDIDKEMQKVAREILGSMRNSYNSCQAIALDDLADQATKKEEEKPDYYEVDIPELKPEMAVAMSANKLF